MPDARGRMPPAAILAGDVSGYSRLMGADEEGTLNASPRRLRRSQWPINAGHPAAATQAKNQGILKGKLRPPESALLSLLPS